ncbi:hypothetical protein EDD11_005717 [Mortierella claussenii]|nr:hypothetical protein EDD11_005717 [Mortierella claussenii]
MSTASDGHRIGRPDDYNVLRQKYKTVKHKLMKAEMQLEKNYEERKELEKELEKNYGLQRALQNANDDVQSRLANMDAKLLHAQNLLETNRSPGRNMQALEDFKGIMHFLEVSLNFITPSPDKSDASLLERLGTIIRYLHEKEARSAQLIRTNEDLVRQLQDIQSGTTSVLKVEPLIPAASVSQTVTTSSSANTEPTSTPATGTTETATTLGTGAESAAGSTPTTALVPKGGKVEAEEEAPREKVEAVLTRIMQQHEVTVSTLQSELDSLRAQFDHKETTHRTMTDRLEQKIAELTLARDMAEANLSDARTQVEDIQTALKRAEKGKTAALSSKDVKVAEIRRLEMDLEDSERNRKAKQTQAIELRRELDDLRELYDKAKNRSLVNDLNKIKKLTEEKSAMQEELNNLKKVDEDKTLELKQFKLKFERLQDEKNEDLKKQGLLQEELAAKDLELANARSTSAGFDSSAKNAERERDAAAQKVARENLEWKQKLQVLQHSMSELDNEREFLKSALALMEEKTQEHLTRKQQESDHMQQKENMVASLQLKLETAEGTIAALMQAQATDRQHLEAQREKARQHERELAEMQDKVEAAGAMDQLVKKLRSKEDSQTLATAAAAASTANDQGVVVKMEDVEATAQEARLPQAWREAIEQFQQNTDLRSEIRAEGSSHGVGNTDSDALRRQIRQKESRILELEQELKIEKESHSLIREHPSSASSLSAADKTEYSRSSIFDQDAAVSELDLRTSVEEEMLREDLVRALTRVEALEELIMSLETDVEGMHRVHEEMQIALEEKRQLILSMDRDATYKEEKVVKLERELARQKTDFAHKLAELIDCRVKLQEQELRAGLLEEEVKSARHESAALQKRTVEQQEQLEGRERALKRLEEARKLYEQVEKSTINRLKEEKATAEKLVVTELKRMQQVHEEEMKRTVTECSGSLALAQLNHERLRESWQNELQSVQRRQDEQQSRADELEQTASRMAREVEERNMLINGYMALVAEKEGQGMLQEGSEIFQGMLHQRQQDMAEIHELSDEVQQLRTAMRDQHNIMERYNENMENLANRNEVYLRQGQERELELAAEKKARYKEQQHYKQLLAEREKAIQVLEAELTEKTDAWKRREARLQSMQSGDASHGFSDGTAGAGVNDFVAAPSSTSTSGT